MLIPIISVSSPHARPQYDEDGAYPEWYCRGWRFSTSTEKKYAADFIAKEGGGRINAKAQFDAVRMAYQAKATAVNFQVQHFVPNYGPTPSQDMSRQMEWGRMSSPRTHLSAKARVVKFKWRL